MPVDRFAFYPTTVFVLAQVSALLHIAQQLSHEQGVSASMVEQCQAKILAQPIRLGIQVGIHKVAFIERRQLAQVKPNVTIVTFELAEDTG